MIDPLHATMGYIAPAYYKPSRCMASSLGIKLLDVLGDLAALSRLPWQAGARIVILAGRIEMD